MALASPSLKLPNRTYIDVDGYFAAHPSTKDVSVVVDAQAIRRSVFNLIFTTPGERLFQPTVGTTIKQMLFDLANPGIAMMIRSEIIRVLERYEPRIELSVVDVTYDNQHSYLLTIKFKILGTGQEVTIDHTIERTR